MLSSWKSSAAGPLYIETDWACGTARGLFTFRNGGVSASPFESLNLGFHVPDDSNSVRANREVCAEWVGGGLEDWIVPEQVHGSGVAVVHRHERGRGATSCTDAISNVDAVVTNEPGITLAVLSADCVPILFYDPVLNVIAAAHSGWKGTVQHIGREVVYRMKETFGSSPADIDVWLGPSIRRCCYEVDEQVATPVTDAFGAKVLFKRHGIPGKYLLSLQACIRQDLLTSGILSTHIHDTGVCTACHTDVLFSHRAERGKTGRFMGAVRLVSPS